MDKYRIVISLVKGDTMITDVYVAPCANMYDAMAKASRYAAFQIDEEDGDYLKHISVSLYKEARDA